MLRCLTTVHEILLTRVTAIYKRNIFNYCCHRLHQRQNLPSGRKCLDNYSAHAYSHSQKSNVQPFSSIPQQSRNYGTGQKLENNILVGSTSGDNVCLHTYSRSQKSTDQPSNSINTHPSRNYVTGRRVDNSVGYPKHPTEAIINFIREIVLSVRRPVSEKKSTELIEITLVTQMLWTKIWAV